MTTLQYSNEGDTFTVVNETRKAIVSHNSFYSRITDQDLIDAAQQAKQNPGDIVAVCSTSKARGLRPSAAKRHFVQ